MKKLIYFALTIITLGLTTSCTSDDNAMDKGPTTNPDTSEVTTKVLEQKTGNYTVTIYSNVKEFYAPSTTPIIVEFKDDNDPSNKDFKEVAMNIMMHMPNHSHSAPMVQLTPVANSTNKFYGEIMFIMAGTNLDNNYWEIELKAKNKDTQINTKLKTLARGGKFYDRENIVSIQGSDRRTLETFNVNGVKHFAALHHTDKFIVGKNDITVSLYKKGDDMGMTFPEVDNLIVTIDPRMPDMGNHGVLEGIITLEYNANTKQHEGKLPLSMTGYWFLNLVIKDQAGEIIAGQPVKEDANGNQTINGDKFLDLLF
ncbi:hypothetical protein [Myroides pelagicus]|uniref:YtkA-like domain-containing protein n=1 Tax=Myroides pelagicus TaxID=270914 RepID=A0A7K1GQ19_9FLAO|nr:hypothetical protein [Myroides pelagicus]MTH30830.1 hypothetical protein [Myroides pelagicus]